MEASSQLQGPPPLDPVEEFKRRNIASILDMIKLVHVNCVLYMPANDTPENVKALVYNRLISIAKLYEPEVAKV